MSNQEQGHVRAIGDAQPSVCGCCGVLVPITHAQISRLEAPGVRVFNGGEMTGRFTSYCMPCEGRAAEQKPCDLCGRHAEFCRLCYPRTLQAVKDREASGLFYHEPTDTYRLFDNGVEQFVATGDGLQKMPGGPFQERAARARRWAVLIG